LIADSFFTSKITTDPHALAESNIKCPNEKYPKLKIHISKLILDSYEYMPVANVAMHCVI